MTYKTKSKSEKSSLPLSESIMTSIVIQNIVDLEHVVEENDDIIETKQNNTNMLPNKKTIMQTDKINDPKRKID